MLKSILVPIDLTDTDLTKPAIATAATLSQTWDGSVRLLNVMPMTPVMLAGSGDAVAKKSLEDNLPTAGLAILDFAIDDWNEAAFRRGKLVRFTSPKLLKQALDD